jgi:hypothetical protein
MRTYYSYSDPIVDNANFDYYDNLVKEEGVLQAGNCCIRGTGKQLAICGRQRQCCFVRGQHSARFEQSNSVRCST